MKIDNNNNYAHLVLAHSKGVEEIKCCFSLPIYGLDHSNIYVDFSKVLLEIALLTVTISIKYSLLLAIQIFEHSNIYDDFSKILSEIALVVVIISLLG